MAPLFLDIERVLQIHRSMIERYGGAEGIRDAGMLHSAIATPQASFGGHFLADPALKVLGLNAGRHGEDSDDKNENTIGFHGVNCKRGNRAGAMG